MKVLQVMGSLNVGGAETFVMNLYRYIDKEKVQFDFVVHSDSGYFEQEVIFNGSNIYRLPKYNVLNHFKYIKAWIKILNESKPHIIHSHIMSTAKILLKEAKKNNYFTISHSHNTYIKENIIKDVTKYFLKKNVGRYADCKFSCSIETATWFFGKKIVKDPNFKVINNSISTEKFNYNESIRIKMRKELNIEDKTIIGHVGRFSKVKNHTRLINIFEEYQKTNQNSVLLLVGTGEDFEYIKQNINENIRGKVVFLGNRSDVAEVMMTFDMMLFPSLSEGFPVTLIEAQSLGIPCLISDVITREVCITNLINYFSLDDSNDTIVDKLQKILLNKNTSNYNEQVKNKGFDIKNVSKELESFYLNTLEKNGRQEQLR